MPGLCDVDQAAGLESRRADGATRMESLLPDGKTHACRTVAPCGSSTRVEKASKDRPLAGGASRASRGLSRHPPRAERSGRDRLRYNVGPADTFGRQGFVARERGT